MDTINSGQIEKLLEDISSIKGVIIFTTISVPISISITFGCGLLIFSALGCLSARADKEE